MAGTRETISRQIDIFCLEMGISADKFSRRSVGDNRAVTKLKTGVGVTLTRIEQFEAFMRDERQRRREALADAEAF